MSYATTAQLREYLKQVSAGMSEDAKLQNILDRATAIINRVLRGVTFGEYVNETRTVYGDYSPYLMLPAHEVGTVSLLTIGGVTVDASLYTELPNGTLIYNEESLLAWPSSPVYVGWSRGAYLVTANWGYGPVPYDVEEVCLELAVNIWRAKDAGRFTNIVGVEGSGAVGYEGALTPQQKLILTEIRQQLLPQAI